MRLILASKSPARLATLLHAGLRPEVIVSDVDESASVVEDPPRLALTLARRKGEAVAMRLPQDSEALILACDSLLEFDGQAYGKPGSRAEVVSRWRELRGQAGVLHTGHHVVLIGPAGLRRATRVASTVVRFADLDDSEIEAYAATGEPEQVAGAFTLDGLGGPFVTSIEGDPHNVVGISLPLLRMMLADLGIAWHTLWHPERGLV